jgi:enoyl-[acyl-carrier-protein] reductase (NADH)
MSQSAGLTWGNDLSRCVTGEVRHVDSGYHVVDMKHPNAPDISPSSSDRLGNKE